MNSIENPLVSIIIPVYGVEKYIIQCCTSLFEQDYNNIEYIFVDDATQDNSIRLIQMLLNDKYSHRASQVKIINKSCNEGLPQARHTGLQQAHGEYVIHVDSDDWVEKNFISLLVSHAMKTDSSIVWCDYFIENDKTGRSVVENRFSCLSLTELLDKLITGIFHSGVWNKLIKHELYDDDIYYTTFNQLEDLVLIVQLFLKAKSWSYIPSPLYHYRINEQSLSFSEERSKKRCYEEFHNFKYAVSFINKKGIDLKELEPDISDRFNSLKLAFMKYPENRNLKDIKNTYPQSIKRLFKLKAPLIAKIKLYAAIKLDSCFIYKITDLIKK